MQKISFNLSKICKHFGVSRSGLHSWSLRSENKDKDEDDADLISSIFFERKEKVGGRQIKMLIETHYKKVMNHKKIFRIKKKYNLVTKIRRKNKYAQFAKQAHEHKSCPNLLDRAFSQSKADEVYSTDITQLNYGKSSKAYLAVFKDLATKEIISSSVSKKIDLKLVRTALDKALTKLPKEKRKKLMIHSDQGFHFTHISYRKKLDENEITQSMSRRGNCIDNAPVESFFSYIKDHLELRECSSFEDVEEMVTKEIDYYNYERPQVGLKKMPPMKYRRHLNLKPAFY